MGEFRRFDLDSETSRAWATFAGTLADRLASLGAEETLSIGLGPSQGELAVDAPALVFSATCDGQLRRTEHAADNSVTGLEIWDPGTLDRRCADTIRLLRDGYGVMHPAFLSVTSDVEGDHVGFDGAEASFDQVGAWRVVEPVDSRHLRELALAAVTEDLGVAPDQDVDGDIIVEAGSIRLFIRVLDQAPVIQIFGRLVHDVADPAAGPVVVAALNSEYPFVKFLFAEQAVFACVHLPAVPFVPAQLRNLLGTFAELADELDDELATRLGGAREIEHAEEPDVDVPLELHTDGADEPDGVPPELLTLIRLDPDGEGLDPERAAQICGYDRALARQLLHIAVGQERVWQQAAGQHAEDATQQARCAEEAAGWAATRRSLADALALIDTRNP